MDLIFFIDFIVPGSMVLPLAAFVYRHKKMPDYGWWIFIHLVASAILNIPGIVLARKGIPNLWLFHIETIVCSFILLQFFYTVIRNRSVRQLIRIASIVFPVFCIINFLFLQSLKVFNTYTRPFESILLLTLCMIYWWQANDDDSDQSWADIATNWFVAGIMLYFSSTFILFLLSNFFLGDLSTPSQIKAFTVAFWANGVFLMITYLLFAIGFLKCKK